VKPLTVAPLTICDHEASSRRRGDEMRKIILLAVIAVIAATATVWSIVTFAKPKTAVHVQSTEERRPVSPHEIMIKQGRSLPVEYWADPF
jgi:flagellar basal body-associated protein FliL